MRGAFLLWEDLLLQLSASSPIFFELLLTTTIRKLSAPELDRASKDALNSWAMRLYAGSEWRTYAKKSGLEVRAWIMQECCLQLTSETTKLANKVLRRERKNAADGEDFYALWESFFDTDGSSDEDDGLVTGQSETSVKGQSSPKTVAAETVGESNSQQLPGWRRDSETWRPLPIGMVHS